MAKSVRVLRGPPEIVEQVLLDTLSTSFAQAKVSPSGFRVPDLVIGGRREPNFDASGLLEHVPDGIKLVYSIEISTTHKAIYGGAFVLLSGSAGWSTLSSGNWSMIPMGLFGGAIAGGLFWAIIQSSSARLVAEGERKLKRCFDEAQQLIDLHAGKA